MEQEKEKQNGDCVLTADCFRGIVLDINPVQDQKHNINKGTRTRTTDPMYVPL